MKTLESFKFYEYRKSPPWSHREQGKFQLLPPAPLYYPIPRGKSMLGVIYGVLLWAFMNATPLGAWGRSVMSLGSHREHRSDLRCIPTIPMDLSVHSVVAGWHAAVPHARASMFRAVRCGAVRCVRARVCVCRIQLEYGMSARPRRHLPHSQRYVCTASEASTIPMSARPRGHLPYICLHGLGGIYHTYVCTASEASTIPMSARPRRHLPYLCLHDLPHSQRF